MTARYTDAERWAAYSLAVDMDHASAAVVLTLRRQARRFVRAAKSAQNDIVGDAYLIVAAHSRLVAKDAESSRRAVRDALSDVLERYPEADLLDLDDAQRQFVVERFVGLDVYNRFCLDLGKKLDEHASSASIAAARFAEVREYIAATVAAAFDKLWASGVTPASPDLARVTQGALRETFRVFEEYLQ